MTTSSSGYTLSGATNLITIPTGRILFTVTANVAHDDMHGDFHLLRMRIRQGGTTVANARAGQQAGTPNKRHATVSLDIHRVFIHTGDQTYGIDIDSVSGVNILVYSIHLTITPLA